MAAVDWVMDPGEMETEGEETMAEVAARLLGQTTSFTSLDVDETQDHNNEEPQSVSLAEAKQARRLVGRWESSGNNEGGTN